MDCFPTLSTDRLTLGKITYSDIPNIVKYANHKSISDNTLTMPYPDTEDHAVFWINMSNQGFSSQEQFIFGIFLKETNAFIGGMGLHVDKTHHKAEMGYWIAESFWNLGYATEAGKAVIQFGFEVLNLHKIYATHFPFNPASGKVLLNIGMTFESDLKQHYLKNGKYQDVRQYCIIR